MAKNKKLDWLTRSTVKEKNSFSPPSIHLYTDLKLDLRQSTSTTVDRNHVMNSITNRNKDLECIYDTECIEHSILTLFKTPKGSRVLVPKYGTCLYDYIGSAITELSCVSIKTQLEYEIKEWEKRVKVLGIRVTPIEDNSQINIEIYIEIPEISVTKLIKYKFDSDNGKIQELKEE